MPHGVEVRQLSIAETEDILKKRKAKSSGYDIDPNLASKLEHAARACRQGVPRAHLLNGNVNEALLAEVFSHHGIGAMVYSNEYQQIPPRLSKRTYAPSWPSSGNRSRATN